MLATALLTKEIEDSLTEKTSNNEILRAESYLYDTVGRRTHSINEKAQVTKYVYDTQGRIETVYYPYSEEKVTLDKQEATEAGLFFSMDKGLPQNMYLSAQEKASLSSLLENISYGRSSMLTTIQNVWKESYTYDANSNRITKTTPWGTVAYKYDNENRLVYSGVDGNGTSFSYDANGNLLSKNNTYKSEEYFYNGRCMARKTTRSVPRMAHKCQTSFGLSSYLRSQNSVSNFIKDDEITTDAFGRRNLVQDVGSSTMRTLYDGFSFDILREAEVFQGGDFTTNFVQSGTINYATNQVSSSRYRYIESENDSDNRYKNDEGYRQTQSRFTGTRTPLYGKGEAVATNRSASISANGRAYFGTDILGSVRSATNEYSTLEDRYEYDIFGTPYEGNFSAGLSNGYTGKPYDTVTGLYNYGYRDYSPQVARFTSVDPIRDGNNWFSYVVNDPVNYVDLWGLSSSDAGIKNKIVVFSAIDTNDSKNSIAYNILVDTDYDEIREAAEATGQNFELITGKNAISANFANVLQDDTISRLVVVAHGTEKGNLLDVNNKHLNFQDTNIPTIDLVGCYASVREEKVIELTNDNTTTTHINTYNPVSSSGDAKIIWWYQTNNVVKNEIPESILSGNADSGEAQTSFIDNVLGFINKK